MEPQPNQPPLIVIVGETASGKSALAVDLARHFNGEIIAADSRTVYHGLDIGTAKPTARQQQAVPHHLLDIAAPNEQVTAAQYKVLSQKTIQNIAARGKVPFLVGGTGLYIDAVLYDFSFPAKGDAAERQRFQQLGVPELQEELQVRGIPLPANALNPRHLVRQLETGGVPAQPKNLRPNTLVLGLATDRNMLEQRITDRVERMFGNGLTAEVQQLVATYGWGTPALQTIGYQEFRAYLKGQATLDETKTLIIRNTIQYAKRQRTWFRRNKSIHWIGRKEESVDLITTFLNK